MVSIKQTKQSVLRLTDAYVEGLKQMTEPQLRQVLSGDPHEAAVWVRMAAQAGIAAGQVRLGRMLLAGEGVLKNEAAAFAWFQRAAGQSDADGLNMLGRCYENGWGTPANPPAAYRSFVSSARLGDAWGQYNLGHCYLDGAGVARDFRLAFFWYSRAADQGHDRAMNLLARCYEQGWGVASDWETACAWYRMSAEAGYFRGQFNWATVLATEGDYTQAAEWFMAAARNGAPGVREAVLAVLAASEHPEFKRCLSFVRNLCGE